MASVFGGVGRPTSAEAEARIKDFLRLLASGCTLDEAAAGAHVTLQRVTRKLSRDRAFRQAVFALLEDQREVAA